MVWLDLGLNSDLSDQCQTLYSIGQWAGIYIETDRQTERNRERRRETHIYIHTQIHRKRVRLQTDGRERREMEICLMHKYAGIPGNVWYNILLLQIAFKYPSSIIKIKRVGCLMQEKFKEYGWDNCIDLTWSADSSDLATLNTHLAKVSTKVASHRSCDHFDCCFRDCSFTLISFSSIMVAPYNQQVHSLTGLSYCHPEEVQLA